MTEAVLPVSVGIILFVGCSNCLAIGPYLCAGGGFRMHPPVPLQPSPMGPYCGFCGPTPAIFTCSVCGMTQGLYMPGMPMPQVGGMGTASLVAPVVQSPSGTPPSPSEMRSVATDFTRSAAKHAGPIAVDMVVGWLN